MEKITDQDTIEKSIRVFIKKPRKLNGHLSITDLTTILTHALLKRLTVDTSFLTPCNLQCNRIISNQINISALYRKDTQPCSACNSYHKNVLIKPLLSNTIQKFSIDGWRQQYNMLLLAFLHTGMLWKIKAPKAWPSYND